MFTSKIIATTAQQTSLSHFPLSFSSFLISASLLQKNANEKDQTMRMPWMCRFQTRRPRWLDVVSSRSLILHYGADVRNWWSIISKGVWCCGVEPICTICGAGLRQRGRRHEECANMSRYYRGWTRTSINTDYHKYGQQQGHPASRRPKIRWNTINGTIKFCYYYYALRLLLIFVF